MEEESAVVNMKQCSKQSANKNLFVEEYMKMIGFRCGVCTPVLSRKRISPLIFPPERSHHQLIETVEYHVVLHGDR